MTRELLPGEVTMFGAGAEVCPETGFVFERGAGAHSKSVQTALFKRRLADHEWVGWYKLNDPHARIKHPHLFQGDGQ